MHVTVSDRNSVVFSAPSRSCDDTILLFATRVELQYLFRCSNRRTDSCCDASRKRFSTVSFNVLSGDGNRDSACEMFLSFMMQWSEKTIDIEHRRLLTETWVYLILVRARDNPFSKLSSVVKISKEVNISVLDVFFSPNTDARKMYDSTQQIHDLKNSFWSVTSELRKPTKLMHLDWIKEKFLKICMQLEIPVWRPR